MDGNARVAGDFIGTLLQMVERNVPTFGNMLGGPLARIPDIQHQGGLRSRQLVRCHLGADAFCRPYQVRSFCEGLHTPSQIASYVIKSDTAQAQGGFQFASILDVRDAAEYGEEPLPDSCSAWHARECSG